jgi:hypothetical protein
MGLDPSPAQPGLVDADEGVPNCVAHPIILSLRAADQSGLMLAARITDDSAAAAR